MSVSLQYLRKMAKLNRPLTDKERSNINYQILQISLDNRFEFYPTGKIVDVLFGKSLPSNDITYFRQRTFCDVATDRPVLYLEFPHLWGTKSLLVGYDLLSVCNIGKVNFRYCRFEADPMNWLSRHFEWRLERQGIKGNISRLKIKDHVYYDRGKKIVINETTEGIINVMQYYFKKIIINRKNETKK